jgi:hypothetical protein
MKIEIVKFNNGKFAIRKTSFFKNYAYLTKYSKQWINGITHLDLCTYETWDEVATAFGDYNDYGTPIAL